MTRQAKTTQDLIAATGAHKIENIRATDRWECWRVEYRFLTDVVRQHLVFLNRECRWQDVDEAVTILPSLGMTTPTIIVRDNAKAMRGDMPRLRARFATTKVLTSSQFLLAVVSNALAPTEVANSNSDPYFIEPSVLLPDQEDPGPALSRLDNWLRGQSDGAFNVAVLLAPAGVGKTTLAEQLFQLLLSKRRTEAVPLLLKREQWEGLANRGAVQLRDIWTASITACYPRSLLGAENLETYLAAGAIRPIFDGLDELCSGLPGDFNPTELIADLADTFEEGRIVITSRTEYWEENVAKATRARVLEVELRPFSPQQRDRYLQKRFPKDTSKRSAALGLLERVSGRVQGKASAKRDDSGESETGRADSLDVMPYAVMLAAESVDGDFANAVPLLDDKEPITGLLLALCERERQRQRLSLAPRRQFRLLEVLAVEFGYSFTAEDLELAAAETAADMPPRELARFEHHALLRRTPPRYRFRYDFVQEYLAARAIREWLMSSEGDVALGERALRACALRPGTLIDRWIDLSRAFDPKAVAAALQARWLVHRTEPTKAAGLSHLALALARASTMGERREATSLLLSAVGEETGVLRGLRIRGAIAGLDLRGIDFVECHFADTEWTKCDMSSETSFERCVFEGKVAIQGVSGFGLAVFEDCELSVHAANAVQQERMDGSSLPVTEEQIVEAVRETLRMFSVGNLGFNPVNVPKLEKHVQGYAFGDKLLRALVKEGVLGTSTKALAGNIPRYEIADAYAARQFLNDAVRLGGIGSSIRVLRERLVK